MYKIGSENVLLFQPEFNANHTQLLISDISAPLINRPGVARAGIQLGGVAPLITDPKPTSFAAL